MDPRNRYRMLYRTFRSFSIFCYLVDEFYGSISKRLIDRAVFSDNLLIVCKEFYFYPFRYCLCDLQFTFLFIYDRSSEDVRDLLSCGTIFDRSRLNRVSLELCHGDIRPAKITAVVAVNRQTDLLRPHRGIQ